METVAEAFESRRRALENESLLSLLPMIYVAWADGELSEAEMEAVCARAERAIGADGTEAVGPWLDPGRPPSALELARLLKQIRRRAAGLSSREKLSLSDLGLAIAALVQPPRAVEREALAEVERALGVAGAEAVREILSRGHPAPPPRSSSAGFDPVQLQTVLDGEHADTRRRLRELLASDAFAYATPETRSRHREHTLRRCRKLAALGYGAIAFPERYGGRDDYALFATVFETLALHDLSVLVKFGVQFGLFGGSIFQLGTERHHDRYLPAVGSLELPGCFAMSETGHGSNVRDIETTATFDPATDEFVVHTPDRSARKDYIGNAACHGRLATVFAQLEVGEEQHGVHALLVPIRDAEGRPLAGVEIEDCGAKMGLNGVDNGRLGFDRVRVPRENLLDRFGSVDEEGTYRSPIPSASARFFTMLGTLVGGRVSVALAGNSVAKSALTIAVRYGAERRQFGPPDEPEIRILDYLTHQRRLLPRLARTYALGFALEDLKRLFADPQADRRTVEGIAAGLKALSTWHATDTVQACRECCGGAGYLAENRFAALKADSDVFTTFEGDNVVLLQLVAKGMLNGYRQQFENLGAIGLVRFIARRAAATVSELNPVVTHDTREDHLRDREFHLGALRWREDHLLAGVARRLKRRLDAGLTTDEALIEVQDHLVEAARAHTERRILARFTRAVEAQSEPLLADVLERLRQLYAISSLAAERGWYQEHGVFSSGKSKAVRTLLNTLCRELRPDAVALVNAFGIPDQVLAAPIAIGC